MKKLLIILLLVVFVSFPAQSAEYSAPTVPPSAEKYMPDNTESFAEGLWQIILSAIESLQPDIIEAATVCFSTVAVMMLVSLFRTAGGNIQMVLKLVSVLTLSALLIKPSNSLLRLGIDTVKELSEYGKLLAPVMTGALAAQGGVTTATVLYSGTAVFNAILTNCISILIVPTVYVYMVLSIANNAIGEPLLKNLRDFSKWFITWSLKTVMYIFTGYMSITGVVSGSTDASAIKAAKLTISGVVPVVGKIISDASDSVLSGAATIKNAAGIYGLLAVAAICIGPFIKVGIHYLLLKLTAAVCSIFDNSPAVNLLNDFSSVMGIILAMVGTSGLLIMISVVCYIKGIA